MGINQGGRYFWFAKYLKKNGYEPIIICANTFHNSKEFIDTKNKKYFIKEYNDIPFVFVKTITALKNDFRRIINMILFYLNIFPVAKKIVKIYGNPDYILGGGPHQLNMLAAVKLGKKYHAASICDIQDLWPEAIFYYGYLKENSLLGKYLIHLEKTIYEKADAIIHTKEGDVDYIIEKKWDIDNDGKIDLKKVFYINIGVDLDEFEKLKDNNVIEDEDLSSDNFKIMYLGAIRPLNNVDKLVETANLLKEYSDIMFLIYGEGNQRESLEKKVRDLKLNNITFKGLVNKQFIPYILSKSSLNILNYSQTQWNWARGNSSNKLFEYMASGKPILSTVKIGYSIIDKYKCGFEIENASAEDLAKSILQIKNMQKKEYITFCQNACDGAKDFDVKIMTTKLINVLNGV